MDSSKITKKYLTNFDYEYALFDINYSIKQRKYRSMRKEFEYVYFFIEKNDSVLINENQYRDDYLDYIKELGCKIPTFSKENKDYLNWWGDLTQPEVERKLNSKITSTQFSISKGWEPKEVKICYSISSVFKHIRKYQNIDGWFFRDPFSVAGRGNFIINTNIKEWECLLERKLGESFEQGLIVSPQFSRILDLGVRISSDNYQKQVYINLLNERGQFLGGLIYSNERDLKDYIENIIQKSWNDIQSKWDDTLNYYQTIKDQKSIQIDSFYYKDKNFIKSYPLVEVNARKTMGDLLLSMKPFLSENGVGAWVLFNNKELASISCLDEFKSRYRGHLYDPIRKEGIILTSPSHNNFISFFIAGINLQNLKKIYQNAFPEMTKHSI